ncbi:hypothetical protein D3C77_526220 [compost metagenome]
MLLIPHAIVQASQGDRVAEQGQAGVAVQAGRPQVQRFFDALGAQRFDRRCDTMTRSRQGAGQGVLLRVDHGTDETVVHGVPAVLVGVLVGGQQLVGRGVFLGDQEQAFVLGTQAQVYAAGDHRDRDRQHQRTYDRHQPPQEARVQPRHQQRPSHTQQGLRAMTAYRFAPRR